MESNKSNALTIGAIFLVSPLFALILAVRNFKVKQNHLFIILFFTLYGYSFIPIHDSDVENHLGYFKEICNYSFSDLMGLISNIYSGESRNPDFYIEVIIYLSSRISTNPKLFLTIIAFLYFTVLIKLIAYVYSLHKPIGKKRFFFVFLLGAFMVWSLSSGINNIRFPMAFMVFSLYALKYVHTKNKKFILFALLSVFIHFSLIYSCIFLLIYATFGYPKKNIVLYGSLIILFIFSLSLGELLQSNIGLLGQAVGNKYTAYTDESYIDLRESHLSSVNWYIQLNRFSTYYFAMATLLLSRLKSLNIKFDTLGDNLYGFAIIMLMHNLLSGVIVDTLSNRFYLLFNLFVLIYLFYISSINTNNKFLIYSSRLYLVILTMHILIILRADLYTVSPILLFGNMFIMFFTETATSVQELFLG